MQTEILWEDWMTFQWDAHATDTGVRRISMPASHYIKLAGRRTLTTRIEVLSQSNITVELQTAATIGGPWTELQNGRNVGMNIDTFNTEAGRADQLAGYVRWVALVGAQETNGSITFRIGVIPGLGCKCQPRMADDHDSAPQLAEGRWITVWGNNGTAASVEQSSIEWVRPFQLDAVMFQLEAVSLRNADVRIEGALTAEGPWHTVVELQSGNSPDDDGATVSSGNSVGLSQSLQNYFRWRVAANGGNPYSACFQVKAIGR